jgi:hypothetical protein
MPRKRRFVKRRELPSRLSEISEGERRWWSLDGPFIVGSSTDDDEPSEGHAAWPTWQVWIDFYAAARHELYPGRPRLFETSVAEGLYRAHCEGRTDLEAVREELIATLRPDPRHWFLVEDPAERARIIARVKTEREITHEEQ